ncbi:MarR family transcriptional regulator|uniref:DNA-binding transcriptional regulator, MarR family n=1 Tax=Dendrosporobacter quercicolus TaxID=146817 RepID=A0A1G9XE09_9FIRM|nr:MarR family transcriptional regulator [Dendrosporobacter quercicolus]NSL49692.1 MarR family transcriptional regulator [Dendrosporobacter quercicolus DSM 1736]SDM94917.1 DNA-binding transcriptional regulator, MarR family [Dendrosporobacter quercicolus]
MYKTLHHLLACTYSTFSKQVLANLFDSGLTSGQPKVLDYLKYHNGCVQKDIAAGCEIEASTVTSLLLRMEEGGLIERRMRKGNRRSLYVFLTDKGIKALEKVSEVFDELETLAFEGFSTEEKMDFLEKFFKIYGNLTKENK